jgi:cation transport ATPase
MQAADKPAGAIELEVIKEVSQSYLTQLWNNDVFSKTTESAFTNFSNAVSKYFTAVVLLIATAFNFSMASIRHFNSIECFHCSIDHCLSLCSCIINAIHTR